MDKKIQDSSNAKAGQPELKKSQAQVARDCARWKEYWKHIKVARQLRGENLAKHYHLQELETVASPQVPVVSQQDNSRCLDFTSAVSQSYQLQETVHRSLWSASKGTPVAWIVHLLFLGHTDI